MTLILVTHDPGLAALAGRIVHMRDGRIVDETHNRQPIS
jgi:predicted ABC-type transport system involved in lysophospholipase L1 biosynthesis ATPase subunit